MRLSLLLLGAALASAPAEASELSDILDRGALRVGSTGDYPPFSQRDRSTGAYAGFDVELAASLAAALGVRLEFVQTSWPGLAQDFDAGRFDIAMGGVSVTLDRAKHGFFSQSYLREGKTPIARCADKARFEALAQIDRPEVTVIVNPGGGNERFDRQRLHAARIVVYPDNTGIFDRLADGGADLMITDASETRYQQKLHPGVLCAIHPDAPFDFGEKAYWLPFDAPFLAFVDQWLHAQRENGTYAALYDKWLR